MTISGLTLKHGLDSWLCHSCWILFYSSRCFTCTGSLNWIIVELCRTPVDVFLQPHNQSQVICYCIHSLCMAQCCFYMSTQLVYFSVSNCDCLECASVTVILHLSSTPVHGFLTQNYMELNGLSVQPTGCGICFKKYFKYAIICNRRNPLFLTLYFIYLCIYCHCFYLIYLPITGSLCYVYYIFLFTQIDYN